MYRMYVFHNYTLSKNTQIQRVTSNSVKFYFSDKMMFCPCIINMHQQPISAKLNIIRKFVVMGRVLFMHGVADRIECDAIENGHQSGSDNI